MSIQSEIARIKDNINDAYSTLEGFGADIPENTNSENLARTVNTIKVVRLDAQDLTETQKEQVRANIGVDGMTDALDTEYIVCDPNGNAIVRISSVGLSTTKVSAQEIVINDRDIAKEVSDLIASIKEKADKDHTHEGYVTADALTDKADKDHTHEGYVTADALTDKADKDHTHEGYVTADALTDKADKDHTHEGYASTQDLADKANKEHTHAGLVPDETLTELINHKKDHSLHVTPEDKAGWFDGKYESLDGAPKISENDDTELKVVDAQGNVVAVISDYGLITTQVSTNRLVYGGKNFTDVIKDLKETLYNELYDKFYNEFIVGNPAYGTNPTEPSDPELTESGDQPGFSGGSN